MKSKSQKDIFLDGEGDEWLKRNKRNPYDLWYIKYLPLMIFRYSQCNYLNRRHDYK